MTDEQILNALKSCGDGIAICDDCPYDGRNHCSLLAKQDIIARFEGLKAENESLVREADENAALAMQHKMRVDDLEKENAALRERLEKAVELPIKVGDIVWLVGHLHGTLVCVDANITYISMNEHFVRYTAQEDEWFHDFNDDYIGRYVFLTKQEAEAKLAELKEKDDEETDKT